MNTEFVSTLIVSLSPVTTAGLFRALCDGDRKMTLFGFDVYDGYTCKTLAALCPMQLMKIDGTLTPFDLKKIYRTRCNSPAIWPVIYRLEDGKCYLMRQVNLHRFLTYDDEQKSKRLLWTNPAVLLDLYKFDRYFTFMDIHNQFLICFYLEHMRNS